MKTFTLGFSPCPNDTFIFDALVNGGVSAPGYRFEAVLEDVQTLNEWAAIGKLDVTKISYGAYAGWQEKYRLLMAGGAMGFGVGPLLISKNAPDPGKSLEEVVAGKTIAIPGKDTTAHFLLNAALPNVSQKEFIRFDEVEDFVAADKGLGVIIHENRFTYSQKGLHKLADLGELWENKTGYPIPLGGIVIKKDLPVETAHIINDLIADSLKLAWKKYPELSDYVRQHAQEMQEPVMRSHIDLYVNDFSADMGEKGKAAIRHMVQRMDGHLPEPVFAG